MHAGLRRFVFIERAHPLTHPLPHKNFLGERTRCQRARAAPAATALGALPLAHDAPAAAQPLAARAANGPSARKRTHNQCAHDNRSRNKALTPPAPRSYNGQYIALSAGVVPGSVRSGLWAPGSGPPHPQNGGDPGSIPGRGGP